MGARQGQKLKLLWILKILEQESDEEHPISATELCRRLNEQGITAERKSVYDDIRALCDFGYEILYTRMPRSGYYLADRAFELPEVYLLTDAVQAAGFITVRKTRELVRKLDGLLSREQAKKREKGIYIDNGHKCDNEEIYYNIDTLSAAIAAKKKVHLLYRIRSIAPDRSITVIEKPYILSPYALAWQNDHYYLIGNYEKYDNLMHIRLDRMKKVCATDEPIRPFSEVSRYKDYFDVADYTRRSFQMYAGELTEIQLQCSTSILEQVIDRFSDKIYIRHNNGGTFTFTTTVLLSEGLVNWILQFGPDIQALKPPALRQRLANRVAQLADLYGDENTKDTIKPASSADKDER